MRTKAQTALALLGPGLLKRAEDGAKVAPARHVSWAQDQLEHSRKAMRSPKNVGHWAVRAGNISVGPARGTSTYTHWWQNLGPVSRHTSRLKGFLDYNPKRSPHKPEAVSTSTFPQAGSKTYWSTRPKQPHPGTWFERQIHKATTALGVHPNQAADAQVKGHRDALKDIAKSKQSWRAAEYYGNPDYTPDRKPVGAQAVNRAGNRALNEDMALGGIFSDAKAQADKQRGLFDMYSRLRYRGPEDTVHGKMRTMRHPQYGNYAKGYSTAMGVAAGTGGSGAPIGPRADEFMRKPRRVSPLPYRKENDGQGRAIGNPRYDVLRDPTSWMRALGWGGA